MFAERVLTVCLENCLEHLANVVNILKISEFLNVLATLLLKGKNSGGVWYTIIDHYYLALFSSNCPEITA